jgi:hypothetical protein
LSGIVLDAFLFDRVSFKGTTYAYWISTKLDIWSKRSRFDSGSGICSNEIYSDELFSFAASNDLHEVQSTIALNYHISPSQANIIYQQLGTDYSERIIAPTIQESVKASVQNSMLKS